jgi:hypothetical protein
MKTRSKTSELNDQNNLTIDHLDYSMVKSIKHKKTRIHLVANDFENGTDLPHEFECMPTGINLYIDYDLFKSSVVLLEQNRYLLVRGKRGNFLNFQILSRLIMVKLYEPHLIIIKLYC